MGGFVTFWWPLLLAHFLGIVVHCYCCCCGQQQWLMASQHHFCQGWCHWCVLWWLCTVEQWLQVVALGGDDDAVDDGGG